MPTSLSLQTPPAGATPARLWAGPFRSAAFLGIFPGAAARPTGA